MIQGWPVSHMPWFSYESRLATPTMDLVPVEAVSSTGAVWSSLCEPEMRLGGALPLESALSLSEVARRAFSDL